MKITTDTVLNIAKLSKLNVLPEEAPLFQEQLSSILEFIDQLNELDTEGVEPLTHMSSSLNNFRTDVALVTITQNEALKNAPKKDSFYFRVPKVIE